MINFSRISAWWHRVAAEPKAAKAADSRIHPRYRIRAGMRGVLQTEPALGGGLRDLSYGGCRLFLDESIASVGNQAPIGTSAPMELQFFDSRVVVDAVVVYRDGAVCGINFKHRRGNGLLWLRDILEPLRCGMSLKRSASDQLQGTQSSDLIKLWGDGSTVCEIIKTAEGDLKSLFLTTSEGSREVDFRYREGVMKTSRSVADEASAMSMSTQQMVPTAKIDHAIVRIVLLMMLSLEDEKIFKLLSPAIDKMLDLFDAKPAG